MSITLIGDHIDSKLFCGAIGKDYRGSVQRRTILLQECKVCSENGVAYTFISFGKCRTNLDSYKTSPEHNIMYNIVDLVDESLDVLMCAAKMPIVRITSMSTRDDILQEFKESLELVKMLPDSIHTLLARIKSHFSQEWQLVCAGEPNEGNKENEVDVSMIPFGIKPLYNGKEKPKKVLRYDESNIDCVLYDNVKNMFDSPLFKSYALNVASMIFSRYSHITTKDVAKFFATIVQIRYTMCHTDVLLLMLMKNPSAITEIIINIYGIQAKAKSLLRKKLSCQQTTHHNLNEQLAIQDHLYFLTQMKIFLENNPYQR